MMMKNSVLVTAIAILALVAAVAVVGTTTALAAEVNPAHDADNGNGNEKNFGQCKAESNNDQACIAKFK